MDDNTIVTIIHTNNRMNNYISQATKNEWRFIIQFVMDVIPKKYTHCTFRNMVQTLNRLKICGHRLVRVYV